MNDHDIHDDHVGTDRFGSDDDLARMLRGGLAREAATIVPRDRFAEILTATEEAERHRSPWRWVGIAAVVLLLAGIITPLLLSQHTSPAPTTSTTPQVAQQPTSSSSLETQQLQLPVYYVSTANHLLYPESRDLPTLTNRLTTAVNAVLTVAPANAQYSSLWKGGTVLSTTVEKKQVVVNLSSDAYAALPRDGSAMQAAWQMYWTVNAVLTGNDEPVNVVLESDGNPTVPVLGNTASSSFWSSPVAQGPVYIDIPVSGTHVNHGAVRLSGHVLTGNAIPVVTVSHADGSAPVQCKISMGDANGSQWTPWSCVLELGKGEYQASASALGTTNQMVFSVS